MSPKNEVFRTAYYRVRFTDAAMHVTKGRNLLAAGDEQGALVELLRATEIDPSNEAAQQEIAQDPRAPRAAAACGRKQLSHERANGGRDRLDRARRPS